MKKLALALWILASAISVGFAEISDEDKTEELILDRYNYLTSCLKYENPTACQALIDNGLSSVAKQCDKEGICNIIGGIYEIAGYTDDAIEYYEQSLALGNYMASYFLAKIYYKQENYSIAKNYAEIACEKLSTEAKEVKGSICAALGVMYDKGRGVRQDFFKATQYHKKACDLGDASGCNNLGVSYSKGQGVKQNKTTAKKYYGKACDFGDQMGCDNYRILNEAGVQ